MNFVISFFYTLFLTCGFIFASENKDIEINPDISNIISGKNDIDALSKELDLINNEIEAKFSLLKKIQADISSFQGNESKSIKIKDDIKSLIERWIAHPKIKESNESNSILCKSGLMDIDTVLSIFGGNKIYILPPGFNDKSKISVSNFLHIPASYMDSVISKTLHSIGLQEIQIDPFISMLEPLKTYKISRVVQFGDSLSDLSDGEIVILTTPSPSFIESENKSLCKVISEITGLPSRFIGNKIIAHIKKQDYIHVKKVILGIGTQSINKNISYKIISPKEISLPQAKSIGFELAARLTGSIRKSTTLNIIELPELKSLVLVGETKVVDEVIRLINISDKSIKNNKSLLTHKVRQASINNLKDYLVSSGLVPESLIGIDSKTNQLVITCNPEKIDEIKKAINLIDSTPQTLQIECLILENSESKSINPQGTSNWIFSTINLLNKVQSILPSTGISFGIDPLIKAVSYINNISSDSFRDISFAKMGFLNSMQGSKIEYAPFIMIQDGKEGLIKQVLENSLDTGYVNSNDNKDRFGKLYSRFEFGLNIKLSPRIIDEDTISIDISAGFETAQEGGNERPEIAKRHLSSTVCIEPGKPIIIGGLKYKEMSFMQRFIHESLPRFFGRKTSNEKSSNLMFVITANILDKKEYDKVSVYEKVSSVFAN